jgi:hypothetical protein
VLRQILLSDYRHRTDACEVRFEELEHRLADEDALVALLTPVLGRAIRRSIGDAREEMIEALYPIVGQLVLRAVSEAMRDLARTIDAQVRTSFDLRTLWWRLRARFGGASRADLTLRASLPFELVEIFLIHRDTGLLLQHSSASHDVLPDSHIISGMLTAIRDFAQDTLGRDTEGQLEEIEYGDRRILIEASQHAYLAAVVEGTEPVGFRAAMRRQIIEIEHTYDSELRNFKGDPAALPLADNLFISLAASARSKDVQPE